MSTSLALGALFILLGGTAHILFQYDGKWWWRVLTILNGLAAAPPLIIYMIEIGLPTALAISILLLLAASGLIYLISLQRKGQTGMRVSGVRWEKLGQQSPEDPKGR